MEKKLDHKIQQRITEASPLELPDIVESRINQTLATLPKRKPSRTRKPLLIASATLLITGGIIGSGFISPTMAEALKAVPMFSKIFDSLGDEGIQNANRKGFTSSVKQSATDQGITLTISEALYDGTRISLGIIEEASGTLPPLSNREQRYKSNSYQDKQGANWWVNSANVTHVDAKQNIGVLNLQPVDDIQQSDSFTFHFEVRQIGTIKGKWAFTIPITKTDTNVKKLTPMITKNMNTTSLTLTSVAVSSRGTEIKLRTAEPRNENTAFNMSYQVMDEHGFPLTFLGGGGRPGISTKDGRIAMEYTFFYTPMRENAKSLIIKPFTGGNSFGEAFTEINRLPLTIKQGDIGSITVKKVEFLTNKTILHYDVIGNDPYNQAGPIWLVQGGKSGKKYDGNGGKLTEVKGNIYSFIQEYPALKKDEAIQILTYKMRDVKFYKELEIKLPIR
ncbi:DUF4179 domain-containing protein [Aneurinibacillus migulanus]|uniref:DUF4179 domain-containing protein n=1 Tax=Aneurinibacillus migulanus TaxID=47500 RepID=A0A0D1VHU3_ANEMI|nr:DUF4179 domain-containing protein [Aneurinibacillus migulanus]KIV59024.1 hypothetical protein TS65_03575 [Aneurinibacillus migulanus]KON99272.1 hypothetical protein AF333_00605 [Aneurinibacillus migulanus]MED0893293.1 DUF4179 domain-containing protein [Aneurinibacillus migulanus]MED1615402.1 DUF4179 domain-containing protein [Aneurinibacillus migulanus]SDI57647.1 protein of unknown function [Aneurinibacillus migulanus]